MGLMESKLIELHAAQELTTAINKLTEVDDERVEVPIRVHTLETQITKASNAVIAYKKTHDERSTRGVC